ncbi:MAG: GHMP kinase [Candidatus Koribacter versatilis]|uniref:GHMP kinase n=1 Tax=Candidatus Korobacter versatilis TaxID=658062 RepID=A0A932A699_9BACT|nr:GHMP kinase [Candidatus Koribacter versatilis]
MAKSETIVAHAACRVDLAGGTMDIWPLYLFHAGAVTVNFAVNILTRCRIAPLQGKKIHLKSIDTRREETFADFPALCRARTYKHPLAAYLVRFFEPEGGLEIETNSESPAGAGISGSSALMIATTAALARWTGRKLSREAIRVLAQNVEAQLIKVPTGCQDYYPALYGGVNAIHLEADGIHREAILVPPQEMEARFVLAYTGAPRQSGINNWEVFQAHINGNRRVLRNFDEIGEIARGMHSALARGAWRDVAGLLRAEWKLRRTNAPGITTPLIEKLIAEATKNGATAAKVCGAGGGGCVVFFTPPERKHHVLNAVSQAGGRVLPFQVAREGVTVVGTRG